jgi:hypothetical protein
VLRDITRQHANASQSASRQPGDHWSPPPHFQIDAAARNRQHLRENCELAHTYSRDHSRPIIKRAAADQKVSALQIRSNKARASNIADAVDARASFWMHLNIKIGDADFACFHFLGCSHWRRGGKYFLRKQQRWKDWGVSSGAQFASYMFAYYSIMTLNGDCILFLDLSSVIDCDGNLYTVEKFLKTENLDSRKGWKTNKVMIILLIITASDIHKVATLHQKQSKLHKSWPKSLADY